MASKNYELVSFIRESGTASPAEIAERFSVGTRTVYNRINRANDDLAGIAQIERRGEGFALAVADDERFAEWLRRRGDALRTGMPTTSAERVRYLLNDLLFRTDWVTLDMLSSILYVSRVSISKDLPRVEERLGAYGLTLVRKPHYGIRVEGPEIGRRLCLASLVTDGGGEAGLDARTAPIARADLDAISQCIDTVLDENDMHINAVAYQNLLVHIAIALVRIKDACYLPAQEDYTERVKKSSAYPVANRYWHTDRDPDFPKELYDSHVIKSDFFELIECQPVVLFLLIGEERDLAPIAEHVRATCTRTQAVMSSSTSLELMSVDVSKGQAIESLYPGCDVFAIGDAPNDYGMFDVARVGYLVSDAECPYDVVRCPSIAEALEDIASRVLG